MNNLQIQTIKLTNIRAYKNNPKLHNRAQVAKIRESIREFGFINPVLLNENLEIIAGHGRVAAARDMGMHDVPAIILTHLTNAQKRAYRIADNKLTELGKWSIELLNLEVTELSKLDLNFDLDITGFETGEIDLILDGDGASDPKNDMVPALTDADRRCRRGDIWRLGRHKIISKKEVFIKTAINKGIVGVSGVHIQRPMRCVFPRCHLHRQRTNQRSHGLVLISMALRF